MNKTGKKKKSCFICHLHTLDHIKTKKIPKNIYFCFIDYTKTFDSVNHSKLWKIVQQLGIPDHLTCCLRNLYAVQEATVINRHGKTDRFQIEKGLYQVLCVITLLI